MPRVGDVWSASESNKLFTILKGLKDDGIGTNWKKIMEIYNSQTTAPRSAMQARNHVCSCHSKYKAYVKLHKIEGISFDEDGLPVAADDRIKNFIESTTNGAFVTKNIIPDILLWDGYFGRGRLTVTAGKRKETESGNDVSGDSNPDSFLKSNHVDFPVDEYADVRKSHKRFSVGSCSLGQMNIRDADRIEGNVSKLKDFIKPTQEQEHSDKLYFAVTSLEQVQERGNGFAARAIKYLVKEKLDHFFIRAESKEMQWEWIKDLE